MGEPFEGWEKPSWDDVFLSQAMILSMRSMDTNSKFGCVVVRDNIPLISSYNGPVANSDDGKIPMTRGDQPNKYAFMIHAEENALNLAAREGINLNGATWYVTGPSCHRCYRGMLQSGAKKIVYGQLGAVVVTEEDEMLKGMMDDMLIGPKPEVVYYKDAPYLEVARLAEKYHDIKMGKK